MTYDNVKFAEEAREAIIAGVDLATNAIACTFGPNGHNVLINTPSGVQSTKDGKTVVENINLSDTYAQMGVELISEASRKMADTVGDASSTVAILTRSLIDQFKSYPLNSIALFRELNKCKERVISVLESNKIDITNKQELENLASLCANNDRTIGKIVAEAYDKVGSEGLVTFQEGDEVEDKLEISKGFRIESGFNNSGFINTTKSTCELENVYVYISDLKIEDRKFVMNLCTQALDKKQTLLLIAPDFDSEITVFLRSNLEVIKSCCVVAPNFKNYRATLLEDIQDILGETSTCKKVIIDHKTTTFIGYKSNTSKVSRKVKRIREMLASKTMNSFDEEFNRKRLANFTSGLATIYVGGYSETERGNRMDLFEDSILATKQAILGGYIAGGGIGLVECATTVLDQTNDLEMKYLSSLMVPSQLLGTELRTGEELMQEGIIEPYLITKEYLNDSMSIASQILSCDCVILNTNLF